MQALIDLLSPCFWVGEYGKPNPVLVGISPSNPMFDMCRDMHVITGGKFSRFFFPIENQPGATFQQEDPFVFILIIPRIIRRAMTPGNNVFNTHAFAFKQNLGELPGNIRGNVLKLGSMVSISRHTFHFGTREAFRMARDSSHDPIPFHSGPAGYGSARPFC